jgi:hypothetical protein
MGKKFIGIISLMGILGIIIWKAYSSLNNGKKNNKLTKAELEDRWKKYYDVLCEWLDMKREGQDVSGYFEHNGIKTIAIYGMGQLGLNLYYDLQDVKNVDVKYCIDNFMKNRDLFDFDILTTDMLGNVESVDAIIVTPMHQFDVIEKDLQPYCDNILSLEEIFYI